MANIERKWFISYYHQKVQELIPADHIRILLFILFRNMKKI